MSNRKLFVWYKDDETGEEYIYRKYDTDIDLQEALMKLAAEITDKEDELNESDPEA